MRGFALSFDWSFTSTQCNEKARAHTSKAMIPSYNGRLGFILSLLGK
jgi:hypothetical protein